MSACYLTCRGSSFGISNEVDRRSLESVYHIETACLTRKGKGSSDRIPVMLALFKVLGRDSPEFGPSIYLPYAIKPYKG